MPDLYPILLNLTITCTLGLCWSIAIFSGAAGFIASAIFCENDQIFEGLLKWSALIGLICAAGTLTFGFITLIWHITMAVQ